jgi:hypothetical protein
MTRCFGAELAYFQGIYPKIAFRTLTIGLPLKFKASFFNCNRSIKITDGAMLILQSAMHAD